MELCELVKHNRINPFTTGFKMHQIAVAILFNVVVTMPIIMRAYQNTMHTHSLAWLLGNKKPQSLVPQQKGSVAFST